MATIIASPCTLRKQVQGLWRECDLYPPTYWKVTPEKNQRVGLIALEGVERNQPRNRMVMQCGLGQLAEDCGILLINPQAAHPLWWMRRARVRGWTAPGSLVRHNRRYNDLHFIRMLLDELTREFEIGIWYGAGFSAGAHLLHLLAAQHKGLLKGIVSVGGTFLARQTAATDTDLIVFHGDRDTRLPYQGGWSKGFRLWWETLYALGPKVLGSKPWRQFVAYALANGLDPESAVAELVEGLQFISGKRLSRDDLQIVEYVIAGIFGDHEWYADYVNPLMIQKFGFDKLIPASG